MAPHSTFDSLSEFHLRHSDAKIYGLVAHLLTMLENANNTNIDDVARNISNILDDAEATCMLKLICRKSHVDYLQLLQDCQNLVSHHISPKLLLHIACLPPYYVAEKLGIDEQLVYQLLNELHKNFTIDDPIVWLKRFLSQTEKERLYYNNQKNDLLHGLAVVNQPVDTAEERKLKQRKFELRFKPPTEL